MNIELSPPDFADYQKEFLYEDYRFTITEASTKSGKTFSHIYWLFEYALGYVDGKKLFDWKEGFEFWWIAPVSSQSKIAFNRLRRKVDKFSEFKINLTEKTIITPIGTVIRFKSAHDPDNLYGEDVYAAVFDEFTRAKYASYVAIYSTLTATGGPLKMIGNYTGGASWGHQLALEKKNDPKYNYYRVTAQQAVDAGILDESIVEQARVDLPSHIFEALYMAQGSSDDTELFPLNKLQDIFTNSKTEGKEKKYLTCDIATLGSDRFVLVAWEDWHIEEIKAIDKSTGSEIWQMITEMAERHNVTQSNIVYDADGVGSMLSGYFPNAYAFNNGGAVIPEEGTVPMYKNLKSQCFYKLSHNLDKISCSSDRYKSEICTELNQHRKVDSNGKWTVTKKEEIKELLKRSPDFADAIVMRAVFSIQKYTGEYDVY